MHLIDATARRYEAEDITIVVDNDYESFERNFEGTFKLKSTTSSVKKSSTKNEDKVWMDSFALLKKEWICSIQHMVKEYLISHSKL